MNYSKTATTEWTDACQAKSVTSTIVPISEVKNLSMSASGTVAIETTYTSHLNGAKITEPGDPVTATTTRDTGTSWFGYSVTGKYNGVNVTVPGSYYAPTSGSAIDASNAFVSANSGLKWSDLYDFNTYNNPRKNAKANIIVKVEDGSENGTELTAKVDVSDAAPELTVVQLVSLGDVVSPVKTEIKYFTVGNTVAAMNQWNGSWASNHTGDWATVADNIGGVKYTVNITNVEEAANELTHLSNSFTVSGNGTYAPVITGAEIGDKFTVTVTFENGASLTKNVTVGADTYANISSDGSNQDKALREVLGYNR